jgi:hypothetical protein
MVDGILPDPPEGTELARWASDGQRHDRANIVTFVHPNKQYSLEVDVDDPVYGYLIRLWTVDEDGRNERIGQTVVDDRDCALQVASEMAAAADDLAAVHRNPSLGPDIVSREDVDRGELDAPDEWDDNDEWEEALEDAFEAAGIPRSKGTLTTKTIDGRDYYYLQWREGETVTSQYVAPVNPR